MTTARAKTSHASITDESDKQDAATEASIIAENKLAAGSTLDDDSESPLNNIPSAGAQNQMIHEQDEFAENNDIARKMALPGGTITATAPLVSDLPDDVKANMVGAERMEQEELLLKILGVPGAIYTVDKIVMVLWYDHKTKIDRMVIQQRLRSLVHKGLVKKEPRARGIFSITDNGKKLLGI